MKTFEIEFDFGDRVIIDNDNAIVGTITAFTFRSDRGFVVETSWMHNGDSKTSWFEYWRLKKANSF